MIYVYRRDDGPHPVIFNTVKAAINFAIQESLDAPDDYIVLNRIDNEIRNHNLCLVFHAGKVIDE